MRNRFICENHFDETDFKTAKKFHLKNTAIPKKYSLERDSGSDSDTDVDLQVLPPIQTYSNNLKHTIFPSNYDSPPEEHPRQDSECSSPVPQIVATTLAFPDPITSRKSKLKRKIQRLTQINYNYLKKLRRLSQRNIELRTRSIDLDVIKPPAVKVFVKMQLRKRNCTQWDKKEKEFAICLYYKSPAAYLFMRKQGFILPPSSTVQEWLNNTNFIGHIDI